MEKTRNKRYKMTETKTVCFTGHRKIDPFEEEALRAALEKAVEQAIREGATCFRSGGALGFDTMAALTVLKLKKKHRQIRLELYLPFPEQAERWSAKDIQAHEQLCKKADATHIVSPYYFSGVYRLRNEQMINGSQLCIAYLTGASGGTYQTCALALKKHLSFINLYDIINEANNTTE